MIYSYLKVGYKVVQNEPISALKDINYCKVTRKDQGRFFQWFYQSQSLLSDSVTPPADCRHL